VNAPGRGASDRGGNPAQVSPPSWFPGPYRKSGQSVPTPELSAQEQACSGLWARCRPAVGSHISQASSGLAKLAELIRPSSHFRSGLPALSSSKLARFGSATFASRRLRFCPAQPHLGAPAVVPQGERSSRSPAGGEASRALKPGLLAKSQADLLARGLGSGQPFGRQRRREPLRLAAALLAQLAVGGPGPSESQLADSAGQRFSTDCQPSPALDGAAAARAVAATGRASVQQRQALCLDEQAGCFHGRELRAGAGSGQGNRIRSWLCAPLARKQGAARPPQWRPRRLVTRRALVTEAGQGFRRPSPVRRAPQLAAAVPLRLGSLRRQPRRSAALRPASAPTGQVKGSL